MPTFEEGFLKVVIVVLSIFALPSCVSQEGPRQAVSQAAPAGVEPDVSVGAEQVVGQTIYVPIYSHIYTGGKTRTINLTATLSIRNTDAQNPIRLTSARYYGSDGNLLKEYVPKPLRLA